MIQVLQQYSSTISSLSIIPNLYFPIHCRFLILNSFKVQNSPHAFSAFSLLRIVNYPTFYLSLILLKLFFTSFAIISLATLKGPISISSQLQCFSIGTETGDNSVSAVHLHVF